MSWRDKEQEDADPSTIWNEGSFVPSPTLLVDHGSFDPSGPIQSHDTDDHKCGTRLRSLSVSVPYPRDEVPRGSDSPSVH